MVNSLILRLSDGCPSWEIVEVVVLLVVGFLPYGFVIVMEMVHFEEGGGINGAEGSRGDMMSHRLFEGMLVGEIEDGVKRRMSFGELGCGNKMKDSLVKVGEKDGCTGGTTYHLLSGWSTRVPRLGLTMSGVKSVAGVLVLIHEGRVLSRFLITLVGTA